MLKSAHGDLEPVPAFPARYFGEAGMHPAAAGTLLAPVARISGFVLACLVDASTGMVVTSVQGDDRVSLPAAAAGAADIANVLSLLMSQLALDGSLEDALVTFSDHLYVIRPVKPEPEPQILLLVILDRMRANLAMARLEIRDFCAGIVL